jgi:hypothetical protein
MLRYFQTLKSAYRAGKLHRTLLVRLGVLGGIVVIAFVALVVDIFVRNVPAALAVIVAALGYVFGFFVVSKMRSVEWHEHEEVLTVAALDILGGAILVVYFGVRILADLYFEQRFGNGFVISALTLAFFGGIIFGRLIATLKRIDELFRNAL